MGTCLVINHDRDFVQSVKTEVMARGYVCVEAKTVQDATRMVGIVKPEVIVLRPRSRNRCHPDFITALYAKESLKPRTVLVCARPDNIEYIKEQIMAAAPSCVILSHGRGIIEVRNSVD